MDLIEQATSPRKRRNFLRGIYDKTLSLAERKSAQVWLAVIAFIESCFFPIPADVLFVPMALAQPQRAYRLALIATVASVLGSAAGYFVGLYGFEEVAQPMLEAMGKMDTFEKYRSLLHSDILVLWGLLLSSGFAHIPPIKVVTILSGFSGVDFWTFMISAIIGRGARFFLLAWLLKTYGEPIRHFIEKRLTLVAALCFLVLGAAYAAYKLI